MSSPTARHALLLAAGLGTRLRPLSSVRTKAAMPVAGEPIARRIIRWLSAHGVDDVTVNLHHLPATLTGVLGDGSDLGARVRYSWEQPAVLGSAGGPRRALDIIGASPFFIVNGDTLTDVDLGALETVHRSSGARVTLALTVNHEPVKYGGVLLDDRGCVTGFARRGPDAAGSFHFVGVQLADAGVFQPLPAGRVLNSIGGTYDQLLASRPGSIRGYVSEAAFCDIGTPSDYLRTSIALRERELRASADSPTMTLLGDPRYLPSARTSTGRGLNTTLTNVVRDSVLWDDVTVGDECILDRCIVTDGVTIPPWSSYSDMILTRADDGTLVAIPIAEPRV